MNSGDQAEPRPAEVWLEMTRDDFLDGLKRLKPGRMLKSYLAKELQIGLPMARRSSASRGR
jgi:hypothetical protein